MPKSFVAKSGQVRLAAQSFGTPDDPALVLIMGATASMLGWPLALCEQLAGNGLHVLRFDHRDTGQSTTCLPGAPDYSVEDMAADVLAVLDAADLARAHLMGMSLGGYLAQILAVTHPDRVQSLTLYASEPLGWDGAHLPNLGPEILEHFSGLAELDWCDRGAVIAFLMETERLMAGTGAQFDKAAARSYVTATLDRATGPVAAMFNHAQLSSTQDWTGAFRRIACPVLAITGTDDPVLPPDNARALASGIAGAALQMLPGVGHELPARCHDRIVQLVSDRIKGMSDL